LEAFAQQLAEPDIEVLLEKVDELSKPGHLSSTCARFLISSHCQQLTDTLAAALFRQSSELRRRSSSSRLLLTFIGRARTWTKTPLRWSGHSCQASSPERLCVLLHKLHAITLTLLVATAHARRAGLLRPTE
jgi:hypothetical protein